MQISLDPTQHRAKSWLRYELLGQNQSQSQNLVIAECPQFYFRFVDELKKQGCIEYTPDERAAANKQKNNSENTFEFDIEAARSDLTEKEIQDATGVIIQEDNVSGSIYVPGSRNDVILALGGYCYYRHITLKSAQDLIAKLARATNDTPSHHQKRMSTVQSTYLKGDLRDKVTGAGGLVEQFRKRIKDDGSNNIKTAEEKQHLAEYRLAQLDQALNVDSKKPTKEALEEAEDIRLASEKITSDDVRFVIECMAKEAPDDKEPTTQLIYGMFTAFTKTPMSHNTNSRDSGAGKSYIIQNVTDYFPEKYVMQKNAVSNKAIFHRRGVLVQKVTDGITGKEHFEPIAQEIGKLFAEKKVLEDKVEEEKEGKKEKKPQDTKQQLKKWQSEISQINSKIEEIRDNALKWINLENEILLALDTPQDGFLEALMSII